METSNQEQLKKEFMQLTQNVPQDVWWNWVKGWFSEEFIVDTYKNWEGEETLKKEIEKLKNLQEEYNSSVELTQLHKDDIICAFEGSDNLKDVIKKVESLDNDDLKNLASKFMDILCDTDYWIILRETFESRCMQDDN